MRVRRLTEVPAGLLGSFSLKGLLEFSGVHAVPGDFFAIYFDHRNVEFVIAEGLRVIQNIDGVERETSACCDALDYLLDGLAQMTAGLGIEGNLDHLFAELKS
jgi:hypothetical protein